MGAQTSRLLTDAELSDNQSKVKRGTEIVGDTKNCRLVKANLVDAYNRRDIKRFLDFMAPDATCHYKGAEHGMPAQVFVETAEILTESFPDIVLTFEEIIEVEPGLVHLKNFYSRGTHTGKPYPFGQYPAIPPSGREVIEEKYQHYFMLDKKGKVAKWMIEQKDDGQLVGPAGYYVQIGGKIE